MGKYQVHRSDENQREIIAALERVGASVESLGRPVDLVVGFRGQNYLLEVKTPKGKVRPSQTNFCSRWMGRVKIVRSVDEALREIGATR